MKYWVPFHLSVARLYIIFGECAFKSSVYCIFLGLLSKISWPYMNGLFLSSLFCFIGLSICLYASIILFICCSVVMYFEIRKYGCLKLYSLCSDNLWLFKVLWLHMNFKGVLSISVKKKSLCNFDVVSTEFVDCFG